MDKLPAVVAPDPNAQIADLARAYRRANGGVIALANRFGTVVEAQVSRLPKPVQDQIQQIMIMTLTGAHHAAGHVGSDIGRGGSTWAAMVVGGVGGSGGLVTALAELPITITVFLHAIRREARLAGFDPDNPGIRAACLQVFAAASPLIEDDGVNTAFLSARMTLTGPALQRLIATIAPRLGLAMGQKLAAQSVPVLGALSGAALNAAYLSYYREMARIRFALMRLAEHSGGETVVTVFARAVEHQRLNRP